MKVAVDTNILLRLILADDETQGLLAKELMESADRVAISVHALCEFAWVLASRKAMSNRDIAASIRGLLETKSVVVNRPAVEAGLAILDAGGDFADGAIAFEGEALGGDAFVSFDKKAIKLLQNSGMNALLLS
jgi:predicted nucleic-acid-binding protein